MRMPQGRSAQPFARCSMRGKRQSASLTLCIVVIAQDPCRAAPNTPGARFFPFRELTPSRHVRTPLQRNPAANHLDQAEEGDGLAGTRADRPLSAPEGHDRGATRTGPRRMQPVARDPTARRLPVSPLASQLVRPTDDCPRRSNARIGGEYRLLQTTQTAWPAGFPSSEATHLSGSPPAA